MGDRARDRQHLLTLVRIQTQLTYAHLLLALSCCGFIFFSVKRPRGRPRKVPINSETPALPTNLSTTLPVVLPLSDGIKVSPVALGLVSPGSARQGDVPVAVVPAVAVVLGHGAQVIVNKPTAKHAAPLVPPAVPIIAAVSEVAAPRAARPEHGARQSTRLSPPSSTTAAAAPVAPNSNSSSGASKSDVSYKSVMSRRRQNT